MPDSHDTCFVCEQHSPTGMNLSFTVTTDGSVFAEYTAEHCYEGYAKIVHGGIVSSILDDAMVHGLFAKGKHCVTRELNVRFLRPTRCGTPIQIKAWLDSDASPLFILKSELRQHGKLTAKATGSFADPAALQMFQGLTH